MKTLILLPALFLVLIGFSQNSKSIDPRFTANPQLAEKAKEFKKNNPEEYSFLLFELDNAYFLTNIESLNDKQKSQLIPVSTVTDQDGNPFDVTVLSDPSNFNIHAYNFQRSETQTVGYDLGNGMVLVFYSKEKLRAMFQQNSTN